MSSSARAGRRPADIGRRATLLVFALLATFVAPLPAQAAVTPSTTLVFGAADNGVEADNAAATLEELGADVQRSTDLPEDLSAFGTIWFVSAYDSLTERDADRLSAFIAAGGSAYLTGERPCCEPLNASVQRVLRGVLRDQDVVVGGRGDVSGPFTFNPAAVEQLSAAPNVLTDFVPSAPGGLDGITNVNAPNVFASNGSIAVGAAWTDADMRSGAGRVALLMDIDWLTEERRRPLVENIQRFLSRGAICGDDGGDIYWSTGPEDCSTLVTPLPLDRETWMVTTASQSVPVDVEVTSSGVTADCQVKPYDRSTEVVCVLTDAAVGGGRLTLTATVPGGEISTRTYDVRQKNDSRNVPVPFRLDSDWWEWPDSDDDGLPDKWEQDGVWVRDQYLDLPAKGADPRHKDLFVHVDFERGYEISEGVFDNLRSAFAASPLTNPDGTTGVDLHIDRGSSVPSSVVGDYSSLSQQAIQRVTTWSGFASSPEFGGDGVPHIYKHMMNFAPASDAEAIGLAYVRGQWGWTSWDVDEWQAKLNVGTVDTARAVDFAQATNFMHELGHLLGLLHHGDESEPEYDERYRSVMSYSYSKFGLPSGLLGLGRRIDYSRELDVNRDWAMRGTVGGLTFVPGQFGEDFNFYSTSYNVTVPVRPEDLPEEESSAALLSGVRPEEFASFAEDFSLEHDADFPRIDASAPTALSVEQDSAAEMTVTAGDRAGSVLTLIVDAPPAHGSLVADGLTITYRPSAGYTGTDAFAIRASNGTLSSQALHVDVDVTPRRRLPAALQIVSGSGQSRPVGQPFQPLVSRVLDGDGKPVDDVPVTFAVQSGGGAFSNGPTVEVRTDEAGVASAEGLVAGSAAGPLQVRASVDGVAPVVFGLTVTPAVPRRADLGIDLTAPKRIGKGETFRVSVTVANHGPAVSSGTTVSLVVPGKVVKGDVSRLLGPFYRIKVGDLRSGERRTVTLVVTALARRGSVVFAGSVTGSVPDPRRANNADVVVTVIR